MSYQKNKNKFYGGRDNIETDGNRNLAGVPLNNNKDDSALRSKIKNLYKSGYPSEQSIKELMREFPNLDVEDLISSYRGKRYHKAKHQARELARKIFQRYNEGNRPLHEILDKMMHYKKRHNWSDLEYDEFRKELSFLLTGRRATEVHYNQNLMVNRSRINKALGNTQIPKLEGLKIKDSEQSIVAEIISMFNKSSNLHRSIFMHSLIYTDCSLVAMSGTFNKDKHMASTHIHPIIACLFLPKFEMLESHLLYSNFGGIVKTRYERKPILNEPDALLFDDITSDPNDVVCEVNSPMADLRNRYRVQIALWDIVLKLRNGNYYDATSMNDFMATLNTCRNNMYDNADLMYNNDEGSMFRRLFSVFSLRPTIVSTTPLYSVAALGGPYSLGAGIANNNNKKYQIDMGMGPGLGMNPYYNRVAYTITSIPMITLYLPPLMGTNKNDAEAVDLTGAISQTLWITENKTIVPKEQSIIYSKEILVFYVNRRVQRIQIRTFMNPLPFSQLPLTMSNFERLNAYPVSVPQSLSLPNSGDAYELRSIVAVTETEIGRNDKLTYLITGNTGLIMTTRDVVTNIFNPTYYLYDPMGASIPRPAEETNKYRYNLPISELPYMKDPAIETDSFYDRAKHNGTIYIYSKKGYNPREKIFETHTF